MCLSFVVCVAFAVLTNTVVDAQQATADLDKAALRPAFDGKYVFGGKEYSKFLR
jgi:hypothetical protein